MSSKLQETWKIVNLVLDPELPYMQCFEEQAARGRSVGNIFSACQARMQGMIHRLALCEPNPPLNCQVLEYEEGEALASSDPKLSPGQKRGPIVRMAQWLGRGLPIEDKAVRPYNKFPVVYLYWRLAYVVIPRGIENIGKSGSRRSVASTCQCATRLYMQRIPRMVRSCFLT